MLVLDGSIDTLQISSNSRPVISLISRLQIFAIFMQVHILKNATKKSSRWINSVYNGGYYTYVYYIIKNIRK